MAATKQERVTHTDRLLAQAVKAARVATERSLEGKLVQAVKAARQAVTGELTPQIKSLQESQGSVDAKIAALRLEFEHKLEQQRRAYEELLRKTIELVQQLPPPQVTVETPPMVKTFEYDAAGRPAKVIEKRAE